MDDALKLKAVAATTRLSRLVRERLRFWLRVATRSRTLGRYHLAGSAVVIHLRHGTVDLLALEEIFRLGHYDAPPQVLDALQASEKPLQVVDLGANIGLFGAFIRRRFPTARIVAFEPHPANAAVLRQSIEANGGNDRWRLVQACAQNADGEVPLGLYDFTTSRIEANSAREVVVPALDVFPFLEDVDLLKIDIEGAEWPILTDPRFGAGVARTLALEYHPFGSPEPDTHALALRLLQRAGYETRVSDYTFPPGQGMFWAWRPA
jgi:FkbM family methyltransferase